MAGFDISFLNQSWGFILTIALLGGIFWRAAIWLNNQQDLKLKNKQAVEDTKALELKSYTDHKAQDLKDTALKMADDVKVSTAKLADEYRQINAKHIAELEGKFDGFYTATTKKDNEILEIVKELTKRANFTNGNVSNIRKDLLELSEDVEALMTRDGKGMGDSIRSSQRQRKRARRLDEINEDRLSQGSPSTDFE